MFTPYRMHNILVLSILACLPLQSCFIAQPRFFSSYSHQGFVQSVHLQSTLFHKDDDETVKSETYTSDDEIPVIKGIASFYGSEFNGRKTANGEIYDETVLTAAHRTLPFGTFLSVTNVMNGRSVIVRVNDRGPFHPDRILDLSRMAAEELDMIRFGVAEIEAEILDN